MMHALIIFLKFPQPGMVKTRLGAALGMERAASLYREMAERLLGEAESLTADGVQPLVYATPESPLPELRAWLGERFPILSQSGETLGDRLHSAFTDAFGRGADRAAVVGTDVPELGGPLILQAFGLLEQVEIVIGPGTDGGYYLLGMKPPVKNLFAGIEWSTPDVLPATKALASAAGLGVALLPPLSDIDTYEDYRSWLARRPDR
jgi:rSAM/selenodomain-associated transferase 1